jgi:hypothetical protein
MGTTTAARPGPARRVLAASASLIILAVGGLAAVTTAGPTYGPRSHAMTGLAIPGTRILYHRPADAEKMLDRVAGIGVRWLRFDAAWSELSVRRGVYDWSRIDRVVAAARARHLSVLLVLGTTASWARPPGAKWNHGPVNAAGRAAFTEFAAAVAARYRGKVAAYEIWNEPNSAGAWAPRPSSDAYFRLLAATYAAMHRVDPGARVIAGGTGGSRDAIDTVTWYTDLYRRGLRTVSDAVAVHPYPEGPSVSAGEMAKAFAVRRLMDRNGDAGKLLWGTETGAPTGGRHAVDERAQAGLIPAVYDRWRSLRNPGPLFYYTLNDYGGQDREDHFGLVRADGSEKPGYAALRKWARARR